MFDDFIAVVRTALSERVLLALNHLLRAEPAACDRLKPHAGRVVAIEVAGLPPRLSGAPWRLAVTPAGLLDQPDGDVHGPLAADLRLILEAPPVRRAPMNPIQFAQAVLDGGVSLRPAVRVEGDARLAADVDWCIHNVRWDAQHDLSQLLGPAAAGQLTALAENLAGGLRDALRRWPAGAGPAPHAHGADNPAAG